jgi:hypothetical protein
VTEVALLEERADHGVDQVGHDRRDDRGERGADDDCDRQVEHVPSEDELPEAFEHDRSFSLGGWNWWCCAPGRARGQAAEPDDADEPEPDELEEEDDEPEEDEPDDEPDDGDEPDEEEDDDPDDDDPPPPVFVPPRESVR